MVEWLIPAESEVEREDTAVTVAVELEKEIVEVVVVVAMVECVLKMHDWSSVSSS